MPEAPRHDFDHAFEPPRGLLEITETLESRGFEAWAVGGALRDELLGGHRADWDVATVARPGDVQRIFRRTVPLGLEHGTVGVFSADGTMYEVTTFRRDVETDGRHAVVEFAETIEEDLARRDFTINALAWRPATDELRDPFRGRRDLEERVLRAVGEPVDRFAEDYLRVLRGLRFAGRLDLEIEAPTWEALAEAARRLEGLSAERVREELVKTLRDPKPSSTLRLYAKAGALDHWYPEVAEVAGGDPRWELDLATVDAIPRGRDRLRLVRWLVPIAESAGERGARAARLLERLKFSNADRRYVLERLRNYPILLNPADSSARVRMWLAEVGVDVARDLFRLHAAEARAAAADERAAYLVALWRRVHDEWLEAPPLRLSDLAVTGDDLVELGVPQGPAIGLLLDELHAEALEDPRVNRREALLERAEELIELGGLVPGEAG